MFFTACLNFFFSCLPSRLRLLPIQHNNVPQNASAFRVARVFRLATVFLVTLLLCGTSGLSADETIANETLIDINDATASVLAEKLPGIGPAKARAIVAHRNQHGPFKELSALIKVKGIGVRTLDKIRGLLFIGIAPARNKSPDTPSATDPDSANDDAKTSEDRTARAVRAVVSVARKARSVKPQ